MLLTQEFETARMRLWPFLQWKQRHSRISRKPSSMRLDDISPYLPPEYRDLTPDVYRD